MQWCKNARGIHLLPWIGKAEVVRGENGLIAGVIKLFRFGVTETE